MPEIKHKKREPEKIKVEDVIVKVGKFRFYFQNYYTIISLVNDILLGLLYVVGSLTSILNGPRWIMQWSYFGGAVFMLMRPALKIIRNIFIYNQKEFQYKVKDMAEQKQKSDNQNHRKNKETND